MRECWAKPLGGCDAISKEHYFTKSLFGDVTITVSGLPFLRGQPKEMPFDALVAKTLCRRHNSALGDVDQAASDTMNAIRRLRAVGQTRRKLRRDKWSCYQLRVDGIRFERWLLKVAFNVSMLLREEAGGWVPPPDAVDIVYGRRPFSEGTGVAAIARLGADLRLGDRIGCALIYDPPKTAPVGVIVLFAGYPFACSWMHSPENILPQAIEDEWFDRSVYRVRHLRDSADNTCLTFDWSGQWSEAANREVVNLRAARELL